MTTNFKKYFNVDDVEEQLQDLFLEADVSKNIENYIRKQYSQRGRYYHGLYHIAHMYQLHNMIKSKTKLDWLQNIAILRAIIFHDVIYDSTRKDNEIESANAHNNFFKGGDLEKLSFYLITETKNHFVIGEPLDIDLNKSYILNCRNWFIGLDLSSLASPLDMFKQNTMAIRAEYNQVPSDDFITGQKSFFKHVLSQDRIYQDQTFYELFEEHARNNLAMVSNEYSNNS